MLRVWEGEYVTFVSGAWHAFHDSFPVQDLGVGDGSEGEEDWRGF